MLRYLIVICGFLFLFRPAFAGQWEVRDVARLNNCPPKKIEVIQSLPGSSGTTLYRVSCALPKATGETKGGADAIIVACEQSLCALVRPVAGAGK